MAAVASIFHMRKNAASMMKPNATCGLLRPIAMSAPAISGCHSAMRNARQQQRISSGDVCPFQMPTRVGAHTSSINA